MAITSLTVRVQKDAGTANAPSLSIAGGLTGQFESTDSETYAATNEIDFSCITGGTVGALAITHIGLLVTNTASTIETFNGVPRADVYSINNKNLAAVKTWNGVA